MQYMPAIGFGPIGLWEIILIVLIIVVLFGAKKLPELGSGLGKGIQNFKKSVKGGIGEESDTEEDNSDESARE